jgi:hypothetical protein
VSRRSKNNRRSGQHYQVRRSTEAEMNKAAVPGVGPGATTYTGPQVAALLAAVNNAPAVSGGFNPLPRLDPQVAFGPGLALIPAAIDPVRRDSGRPEPRFAEYPVSTNLPGVTDRLVPWKVLRDAAAAGGIPRRCIQIRKDEISTLEWAITITKSAVAKAQADNPSSSRADVEADLRKRLGPEIARCSAFWERPDPGQDEDWTDWIGKLLEEHLVLDAIAVYPRRTYGGDLYALEIIDATTVKVLRDYRGGKPLPPNPAYQQILWGFPRGEYVADVDDQGHVINGYAPDTLIYKRRNVRTETLYGFSAVEQCLEDLDVWLRRRAWIRSEFTDGTVPAGLLRNTAANSWTPQQVLEYETALNDAWSGQSLERHRMRILPPGFELETHADVAERYKPEYDLFLLKQLAAHFATTIAELNHTEPGGLGSSGYHEGQADIKDRNATMPTYRWIQGLITGISRRHLVMPGELEFKILGLEDEDEAAADAVADSRVKSARMTYNEDRDRLGLPRYAFPEADMPIVVTTRGVIFLEGASKLAPPGETVTPLEAPPNKDADGDGVPDRLENDQGDDDGDPDETADAPSKGAAQAAKTEIAAYRNWARRGPKAGRTFQARILTKADAPDDMWGDPRVVFAPAGGRAPVPKAGDPDRPHWPGWDRDKETAAAWKPRIRKAMRDALDTRALAAGWIAHRIAALGKADEADLPDDFTDTPPGPDTFGQDPASWLADRGVDLTAALAGLIAGLWAEGYAIGDLSAGAVLTGSAHVDWSRWKPGDADAARLVLDEAGRNGLALLLDQAGITISSIAANRMDKLAKALSDALVNGDSSGTLAGVLRGILDDPAWAEMVAITELNRATSRASLDTYGRNGIEASSWLTALDDRVCNICEGNEEDGYVPLGAAFSSGDTYPPGHPLCFPAGVLVAGPSVVAATARHYEGDLVTIVFADGQEVPVTPNHPVLTPNGWMSAGDLHEGADVLRTLDAERIVTLVYPNDHQAVARIEDVATSLRESGPVVSSLMPLAAEDFHGDGSGDHHVEVVYTARRAELDLVAEPSKHRSDCRLVRAEGVTAAALGDPDAALDSLTPPPERLVSRGQHLGAFASTGARPAQLHSLGPIAAVDASILQHAVDGVAVDSIARGARLNGSAGEVVLKKAARSGDSALPGGLGLRPEWNSPRYEALPEGLMADSANGRALGNRLAGLVESDRVVELRRISDWSGQVFNLETVDGWYFANGIIAHNCRCALSPATVSINEIDASDLSGANAISD